MTTTPSGPDPKKLELRELLPQQQQQTPSPWGDVRTIGVVLGTLAALLSGYLSTVNSGNAARSADNAEEAAKYVTLEKGAIFREMLEAVKDVQKEGERRVSALELKVHDLEAALKAKEAHSPRQ